MSIVEIVLILNELFHFRPELVSRFLRILIALLLKHYDHSHGRLRSWPAARNLRPDDHVVPS